MAEELQKYLERAGVKSRYIHSEVKTLDRVEILRELRLGVWAEARLRAVLAHFRQAAGEFVGQVNGQGHEGIGLIARKAEHHPLVAGTLFFRIFAFDTLVNVGTLFVNG